MKRVGLLIAALLLIVAGVTAAILYFRNQQTPQTPELVAGGTPLNEWLEKLRDPDATAGNAAVDQLIGHGDEGMAILLEARKDADLRAHRRAVAALIRLKDKAAPLLVGLLAKGGARVEVALIRMGADAVPALQEGLKTSSAMGAARILGVLEETARPAVPALIGVVQDGGASAEARVGAAFALGQIGPEASNGPPPAGTDPVLGALITGLSGPRLLKLQCARSLESLGVIARSALPDLIRLARDSDAEVSAAGCRAILALRAPEGATTLADRVVNNTESATVAATCLGRMGPLARPAIPAMIGSLKSAKQDGQFARAVLERLGSSSISDLENALSDKSPEIRRGAAEVLGLQGIRASSAISSLEAKLNDADPGVLINAAQALIRIDPDKAQRILLPMEKLLQHKEPTVADGAALVLAEFGPGARAVTPALLIGLKSKDERTVLRCAGVLGRIRPPASGAVDGLREAMNSGPEKARPACVRALGLLGSHAKDALGDVQKALNKEDLRPFAIMSIIQIDPSKSADMSLALADDLQSAQEVRRARGLQVVLALDTMPNNLTSALRGLIPDARLGGFALLAVGRLPISEKEKLISALITQLASNDMRLRESAGRLLREMPDKALLSLKQALSSGSARTRAGAAWTLRDPKFAELAKDPTGLLNGLTEADPGVRQECAGTLALLGAKTPEAIQRAIDLLGSPDTDLRRTMIRTLGGVAANKRAEILPHVLECLLDPDEDVRQGAAWALGQFEDAARAEKPLTALKQALSDSGQGVRHFAAESLWRLEKEKCRTTVVPGLLKMAKTANTSARLTMVELLNRISPDDAGKLTDELEGDMRGDDVVERIDAAVWLVRVAPDRAEKVTRLLTGIVTGWDPRARYYAAGGLQQVGTKARTALPALRRRVEVDDDREVREAIRRALTSIEGKR